MWVFRTKVPLRMLLSKGHRSKKASETAGFRQVGQSWREGQRSTGSR